MLLLALWPGLDAIWRLTFGGKVAGRVFGTHSEGASRFNLTRLAPVLEEVHERLAGVVIENLPWREFIDRYDRPGMLFYLDPPCWRSEDYYGKGMFRRDEFEAIAERLSALQGRFVMSINDRQETRAVFARFSIKTVQINYSLLHGNRKSVTEILVSG